MYIQCTINVHMNSVCVCVCVCVLTPSSITTFISMNRLSITVQSPFYCTVLVMALGTETPDLVVEHDGLVLGVGITLIVTVEGERKLIVTTV